VHDAAYKGHTKIYRLLSKVPSADRQAKDKLGYTAADYVSILAAEGEMPPLPPDDETLYSSLQSGSVPGKGKKLTHSTASVGSKKSIPGKKK
jgi:hypothetical protein